MLLQSKYIKMYKKKKKKNLSTERNIYEFFCMFLPFTQTILSIFLKNFQIAPLYGTKQKYQI